MNLDAGLLFEIGERVGGEIIGPMNKFSTLPVRFRRPASRRGGLARGVGNVRGRLAAATCTQQNAHPITRIAVRRQLNIKKIPYSCASRRFHGSHATRPKAARDIKATSPPLYIRKRGAGDRGGLV